MFAKLRSLFPAPALGMSAGIPTAPAALRGAAPAVDYRQPAWGRHSNQRTRRRPGISPAVAGPHSEPRVHVRSFVGAHYWFTQEQWDAARSAKAPFCLLAGDVIERVDGYGAVTKRVRVTA
jgi:hypothetical protein